MPKKIKIISVVGARPNFVKIAPFCKSLMRLNETASHILVHTGQHYDHKMSQEFFDALDIPKPDINLDVGSGSHAVQTADTMKAFENVCLEEQPDWVVVVGDVNSTIAATLVAKKLGIKVAHIEAGLRSFDMTMPEEINRRLTDSISDLLFTHCSDASQNLLNEGVDKEKIKMVGNIMIDTVVANLEKIEKANPCEKLGLKNSEYCFVTMHRPSNVDAKDKLESLVSTLSILSKKLPVVFPAHPRTLGRLKEFNLLEQLKSEPALKLLEPVSYHTTLSFIKNSMLVITDSGGIQEETTFLGVPCVTVRPNTERPVTITDGTNRLASVDDLLESVKSVMNESNNHEKKALPPLWDGGTADRIVQVLIEYHE